MKNKPVQLYFSEKVDSTIRKLAGYYETTISSYLKRLLIPVLKNEVAIIKQRTRGNQE